MKLSTMIVWAVVLVVLLLMVTSCDDKPEEYRPIHPERGVAAKYL